MDNSIRISGAIVFVLSIFLICGCEEKSGTPDIITIAVTDLSETSATSGGEIISEGGSPVISRGVCWDTSPNQTLSKNKTSDGLGTGSYKSNITGLTANTTYYVKAYATNTIGTSYGEEVSFKTYSASSTITDIDNNVYNTVTIGSQVWMKENLKTTKYSDGTPIPNISDNTLWATASTGAYCDYSNAASNSTTYGQLYNWYAIDNNPASKVVSNGGRNVCPTGWHVPTDGEWTTLTTLLGGESVAGDKLKETGTSHWDTPNGATNETGFKALPGGYRNSNGTFSNIGNYGYWWSFTEYIARYRYMNYFSSKVYSFDLSKRNGFSVRCLRD